MGNGLAGSRVASGAGTPTAANSAGATGATASRTGRAPGLGGSPGSDGRHASTNAVEGRGGLPFERAASRSPSHAA